jgi:two-component system, NtrC family, response regulator AtoC
MQRATKEKILVIDDEELIRWTLHEALGGWGYTPIEAGTVADALKSIEAESPVVVLLDIYLPDGSGLELLREIKQRHPKTTVIIITANVLVENSVAALRGGAYDFIGKPINLGELQITIRNAIEAQRLRREVHFTRSERVREFNFEQILGESPAMRGTINLARKVAQSDVSSVLLQGESGTGKDMVAKAIHYASPRAEAPFIAINCAALPANLIESELFGYEKGAFTDAKARKEGLFEQAEGGTLFLDEIGELELGLQAKLLRVLEEGTFRRVGGLKDLPLNVRVIASSNRNLRRDSEEGRFRLDLFYRLSVMQIDIPPLRERGGDVLLLAEHFIETLSLNKNRTMRGLTQGVADAFRSYSWPGNVRELRNVIERSLLLEDSDLITTTYLPPNISLAGGATDSQSSDTCAATGNGNRLLPEGLTLDEVETSLVRRAVEQCGGNHTQAARMLGISRDRVRARLRKAEKFGHKSMADFQWKLPSDGDGGIRKPSYEKQPVKNVSEQPMSAGPAELQKANLALEAEVAGRMQAEEAMRESQMQLAGIIASAMDAIITTDSEQRIVIFNEAAERLFGRPAEEAKGALLEEFIPDRFRKIHHEHVRRFAQTGETLRQMGALPELVALRANGEEFPVEASISQIEVGGQKFFTVILRDITERKQSEEKLREQALLLDKAQEAILLRALEGPILYWNQGAERLYGWSAEEAVGHLAKDILFDETSIPQLDEAYRITLDKGEWRGELHQVAKDGSEIIVESRWTLILSKENRPQAILAINTDITEKKRLEMELLGAARLSLIGEMAAGLAHEIKNPLAGIQGAVDILIERRAPGDAERRTLELVRREVGRIDKTVRALLEKARPATLKLAPASLTEVVRSAVLLARHQATALTHQKHININCEPPTDPLVLPLDAAQIEDAVLNLVNNAVEAIDREGHVTVRVSYQKGGDDSTPAFEEALIQVEDDGRGIAEANLQYIFNPFFTESSGGTGLGLAAVRRIARAHGGWVEAKSTLGQGSTFTIHLPFPTAGLPEPDQVRLGESLALLKTERNHAPRV